MTAYKHRVGDYTYWRALVPTPDGKRKLVQAKTKREAEDKARELLALISKGVDHEGGKLTLAAFLDRWIAHMKAEGDPSLSTQSDYLFHVEKKIKPALGHKRLREIRTSDVDGLLKTMHQSGLKSATVEYTHRTLRRALNFAVDWGLIERNPASAKLRAAKRKQRTNDEPDVVRFFDVQQSRRFIEASSESKYEALFVLAITTGLRPGEQFALRWSDIDLDGLRLTVNRALRRTKIKKGEEGQRVYFGSPKTKGSRRTIEIPRVLAEALRKHRTAQGELKAFMVARWKESSLVFTTEIGTPLDISNVGHEFQRLCKNHGLPVVRYYDLRHTHASLLIAQGKHPKLIADRLGHSSIKLTMDTYGHLFGGHGREAAEAMDKMFGSIGGEE